MYTANDIERQQLLATAFWLCVDEFLKLDGTPVEVKAAVTRIKRHGAQNPPPPTLDAVFVIAGLLQLSPETMVTSTFELLAPDGCPNPYGHQIERFIGLGGPTLPEKCETMTRRLMMLRNTRGRLRSP